MVRREKVTEKTLSQYIKQCDDDELYNIFDLVIAEMNKRKEDRHEQI